MISIEIKGGLSEDQRGYETQRRLVNIMENALNLQHAKAQNYGDAFRSQGYMGNVARVLSKAARLRNMLWTSFPRNDADEPVEDTLLDLINLAAFTLINRQDDNQWGDRFQ